jgi:hypothetical protein
MSKGFSRARNRATTYTRKLIAALAMLLVIAQPVVAAAQSQNNPNCNSNVAPFPPTPNPNNPSGPALPQTTVSFTIFTTEESGDMIPIRYDIR